MHLPLPRASGNKNTPATARNLLGIINRNKKRQQNQQPPQPQPLGKENKEQKLGEGDAGVSAPARAGCVGVLPPPWAPTRGLEAADTIDQGGDGTRPPMAPFRKGTVTSSTYHSSFHGCRRQPLVPPLGTGTRWGCSGPEQGSFFLSLGKIYNFCFFFFFLIFIFIYIDIYIYTHLVTRKEKKNRIRNNNNKKKYSCLKTIRSYHARRAGDCTRPTSGWRSRGSAGAAAPSRALPEPPVGACQPPRPGGAQGGAGGALPGSPGSPQASGRGGSLGAAGEEGRGQRLCPSYRDLVGGAPHARDLLDTSAGGAAEGHRPRARWGRAQALGLPIGLAVGCSHLHLILWCQ